MTFASDSLNKSLMRYQVYILAAITVIPVLLEIYCLSVGITTVFPHLFYIPIIAAAYLYPRRGVPFAFGLGIIYFVILVLMGYQDGNILTSAVVRVVVFIGIAAVVSYLAYQLKTEALEYRTLFESTGTATLVIDEDGFIISANDEMEKISGYSNVEVVGKRKWTEFVAPEDLEKMEEYNRMRRSGDLTAPTNYESSFMGKGDRRVDAYLTVAMIPETAKSIVSLMDITALKKAENELRVSDLWFRTVWNNIQAGIVVVDADTHIIVNVNRAAAEIIGYPEEQMKGNVCHKFICPAEVGKCPISDLGQNIDSSERIVINSRGEEVPVLKSVTRMVVDEHEYFVENFVDIRDLKEAENELLAYITEASLRIKNPAELIRDSMADILSQIGEGDTSPEHIKTQIKIQIKNTDKVVDNLRELDRAIAEHRKEIPDEFRKFLSR